MQTKFDIGEKVLIEGIVKRIEIYEGDNDIRYCVASKNQGGYNAEWYKESQIKKEERE